MSNKDISNIATGLDEKGEKVRDMSYTQNRELSWLQFNRRVLQEGCDSRVPLLERLKFISIFTSNLDEFFRVRVGSLDNLAQLKGDVIDNKTGWTASQQLEEIFRRMPQMYAEKDQAFAEVDRLLRNEGVVHLGYEELSKKETSYLDSYYHQTIYPILSPLVIDSRHPFPHLVNEQLYVFCDIEDQKGEAYFGLVGAPSALDPAIFFPDSSHFILLEEVLRHKIDELFPGFTVKSSAIISITRNADIDLDEDIDEMEENIRSAIMNQLKKRNRLAAVRLEIQGDLPKKSVEFLRQHHELGKNQLYYAQAPLRMKYAYMIEDHLDPSTADKISYRPFQPQPSPMFDMKAPIVDQIFLDDKLLHYPYESMDPFLQLLKEASRAPRVISIKITIYRMATVSKVAEYLAQAAENGKEVLVLMELRARFDEENNIDYSERLEQAGCTIIYGFENYKVHSKICLISAYHNDKIRTITQIGTGNYNEKTAKQYTDLAFFTADEGIGKDASAFFKNMLISNLDGKYDHLLVAPTGIKPGLMKLFDREIEKARQGKPAEIILKCNSVSERDLIDKMMQASTAGVKITLIVRGICCIRPGSPDKTENIRVISVVGRFLEHHRIYAFGSENEDIYISSADLMTRNIMNRVEIACPIRDAEVRVRIINILNTFLMDSKKAKELQPDGSYRPVQGDGKIGAQETFIQVAEENARKLLYNDELTAKINVNEARRIGENPEKVQALLEEQEKAAQRRKPASSEENKSAGPEENIKIDAKKINKEAEGQAKKTQVQVEENTVPKTENRASERSEEKKERMGLWDRIKNFFKS